MMRPPLAALLLCCCCLLLLNSPCHGALGFGNRNNQNNADKKKVPRQDIMQDDASTGTVTQLSTDQEDAMTCDGIMAKSLVKANEAKAQAEEERDALAQEKKKALERVAQLQEALTAARTSFDAQVKAMQDDVANVNETIKSIQQEANAAVATAEAEVTKVKNEAEEQMKKITEEHKEALDALLAENEKQIESVYAEVDESTEQILNETHHKIKEYEKTIKEIKEKAKHDVEIVKNETQATLAETQKQWESKNSSIKKESEEKIKQCTEESNAVAAAAEKDRNSIRILMEELGIKSAQELDAAVEEAKGVIAGKEQKFQEIHKEKEQEIAAVVVQSKKQEETLNSEIKKLKDQLTEIEEDLLERKKELANWEELHSKRSYCNWTHVGEDTLSSVATASRRVAGQASVAKEKSFRVAKQAAEQAVVVAAPGIKKSRELYDLHLKQHVDEKVMPVHEKHVAPVLVAIRGHWNTVTQFVRQTCNDMYSFLVTQFEMTCPKIQKALAGINDKMDVAIPTALTDHVDESCANPERSVDSFLRALLILLAILYRRFLWRTAKKLFLLPFRIAWAFTPLRLFLKKNLDDDIAASGKSAKIKKEKSSSQ